MNRSKAGAIVIFVKTPGYSAIKTRLASSIGIANAEQFHLLSARAVESVVKLVAFSSKFTPYWAVAEKDALSSAHWKSFQTVWQGEGELGERLFHVYDKLIHRHSFVIFMGADSPYITSQLLHESVLTLSHARDPHFIMGRAEDGGFYLFGGLVPIPRDIWVETPYSTPSTAMELVARIKRIGQVKELPPLFDIDTVDDLSKLLQTSIEGFEPTSDQLALLKWVQEL